jgi:ABC-type Fe3+-hydroxamate transport system substrate-binding protein
MFITAAEQLHHPPKKIISLVPSITSLLHYFKLSDETTGITKFCTIPEHWKDSKAIIGGTKNIKTDQIIKMKPDLIIANKEENVKDQIESLALDCPVWLTDINTLDDALEMIETLGRFTQKNKEAKQLTERIKLNFDNLAITQAKKYRTCYLIWKDPYMTIGNDTFIHEMLCKAGLDNIFADRKRYPVITIDELQKLQPELILLSSEPYPFREKHVAFLQNIFTNSIIELVDGVCFSWYGDQIQQSAIYFKELHEKIIQRTTMF